MQVHAHLAGIISRHVTETYGEEAQTRASLATEEDESPGSDWLDITLQATAQCLGVEVDSLADDIGFSYVRHMLTQSAYCKHLFHLGNNFPEFINNLDSIHSFIAQRAQGEMHVPSFKCEDGIGGSMEMMYISKSCCYNTSLVTGMMRGVSNLIFQAPISCSLREEYTIRLHAQAGAEDTYKAVYDLNLQSIRKEDEPVIVPIMLAETRKNAEHKISQSHVDNVNKEIAYILETEGPEGHPLRKAARLKARLRWKKLGDVIRGAAFFKFLARKFQPIIPKEVVISPQEFCSLLPFHVMIDTESRVMHAGLAIQRQVPALKTVGEPLSDILSSAYPDSVTLSYKVISSLLNTTFILSGEYHRKDRQLLFKGHFVQLREPRRLLFIGSPYVRGIDECVEARLKISQISEYDVTREFMLAGGWEGQKTTSHPPSISKAITYRTHATFSPTNPRRGIPGSGMVGGGSQNDELKALRDQLSRCRAQLSALKDRYTKLYLGLVPASVVCSLKDKAKLWLLPHEDSILGSFSLEDETKDLQVVSVIKPPADITLLPLDSKAKRRHLTPKKGADAETGVQYLRSLSNHIPHNNRPSNQRKFGKTSANEKRAVGSTSVHWPSHLNHSKSAKATEENAFKNSALKPNYTTYNDVCIMFCDVVNFTQHKDMDEALHELSVAHTWLVRLCQVFRLELVESVGDAFLVISDVSCKSKSQAARNMADCALAYLILNRKEFPSLKFRVGIHFGTVHGGVVERNQKTFLVWGEDVEYACKMEAFGVPGKIQISRQFFNHINDGSFSFEERENIAIRGHDLSNYLLLLSSNIWSKKDLEHIFANGFE